MNIRHILAVSAVVIISLAGIVFYNHRTAAAWSWNEQDVVSCAQEGGNWDNNETGYGCTTVMDPYGFGCYSDDYINWNKDGSWTTETGNTPYDIVGLEMVPKTCTNGSAGDEIYANQGQDAGPQCAKTPFYDTGYEYCPGQSTQTATINVIDNSKVGGTWSITPEGFSGTQSGSVTANPPSSGASYSIAFAPPNGYKCDAPTPISNQVLPGGTYSFTVGNNCLAGDNASVTLTPSTSTLSCNQSQDLTWTGTNVSSCSASWTSKTGASGTDTVFPSAANGTYSYTISCQGLDGSTPTATAQIAVSGCATDQSAPSCSLSASPTSGNGPTYSIISWTSQNLKDNSCDANWTAYTKTSGWSEVYAQTTTTYTMSCQDTKGKTVTCSPTTVTVNGNQGQQDGQQTAYIETKSNIQSGWQLEPSGDRTNGGYDSGYLEEPVDSDGTVYSVVPDQESGYDYPPQISNSKGGGSSQLVFPDDHLIFTLTYSKTPSFDYSLSNSGQTTVRKSGRHEYGTNTITKTLTSGSSQAVTLSVLSGLPSGTSASFSNQSCGLTCSSVLTFDVGPSTPAGSYSVVVSGSPSGHTTTVPLQVNQAPGIQVSCVPSPAVAGVNQAVTWTASASGGIPPYTYTWSGTNITPGNPSPDNTLSVSYSTTGQKMAAATVTDSHDNVGSCTPAGTAEVEVNPNFQEF